MFEAQTDDFFPTNSKGIHQIAYDLNIPNQWFIELFEVLEQYNFTIDENSIYDAEVSIDPEMLGTIFENLLAEIDPDTEKSARKATGSFYTPREIVDYMVEQSLVQYLKTKVSTENEEQLLELFKEGGENKFEPTETKNLLEALSDVKILDPACGSGAFPMGALHKIINALQKLDPDATWWKEKQIENVPNALARKMLKEKLDGESADYVRKLGVIQNSIYGVDIQPIASEISKLRSFLSLVIDETIIDKAENRGIQALPNLEFKFVTANTLIGLPEEESQQFGLFDNYEELQKLKQLRAEYLQSHGSKKIKIKERFLKVQKKAFKKDSNLFTDVNSRSFLITSWNPFKNEPSTWFDPQWMFGIEKFDIVIGNPPYGVSVKGEFRKKVLSQLDKVPDYEIYYFFLEVSKKFLDTKGITTYIIPNTFLFNVYAKNYRTKMLEDWKCFIIDCTSFKIFDKATVLNAIVVLEKTSNESVKYYKTKEKDSFNSLINQEVKFIEIDELLEYGQNWGLAFKLDKEIVELTTKIKKLSKPLIEMFPEISQGLIAYDKYQGQDEETIKNRIYHYDIFSKSDLKKWLWGEDVKKYILKWNETEWLDYCDGIANPRDPKFFKEERILIREITNPSIFATITDEEYYHDPAIIIVKKSNSYSSKVLLALLNSSLATFFHFNYSPKATKGAFPKIIVDDIRNFPLPQVTNQNIIKLEDLVDKILDKGIIQSDISKELVEIDIIFYKHYNLIYEEVKIIDPEFNITEEEYTNYQIN